MKINKNIIISILILFIFINIISASLNVVLADHGSNIKNKNSGAVINGATLKIYIYDSLTG